MVMNGARIHKVGNTLFIPLSREQWRSCGKCQCEHCQGKEGYWDTLALRAESKDGDHTWTVHMPKIHGSCV